MNQEFVKEVLKTHFNDPKTRVGEDAAKITAEVVRTLIEEMALRMARQACRDGSTVVELEHIEKILPQLIDLYLSRDWQDSNSLSRSAAKMLPWGGSLRVFISGEQDHAF